MESARAGGAGPARIMASELLPNVATTIVAMFALAVSNSVVLESALSFLARRGRAPGARPARRGHGHGGDGLMLAFGLRRLGWALVTMVIASIVAFTLFWAIPNVDPEFRLGGGVRGTDATRAGAADRYGLDDPLPVQYVRLMGDIATGHVECFDACGDLRTDFVDALPVTLSLVAGAALIALGGGARAGPRQRALARPLARSARHARRRRALLDPEHRRRGGDVGLPLLPLAVWLAFVVVMVSALVDIAIGWLDPRVRAAT
ncbi:MAG: hypothetical protein ACRDL0_14720 [Thermoleophilaceae bacterium]